MKCQFPGDAPEPPKGWGHRERGDEGTRRTPRLRRLQLILNRLYYTDTELRTDIT